MNRYGFNDHDVKYIISKIANNNHLNLSSICSHLSAAEDLAKISVTLKQIEKFKLISEKFESLLGNNINKHILNSNGVLNFAKYQMDSVRLGIGLYGSTTDINLKQISTLTSVVAQIRSVKKGDSIGYGNSFIAKESMKIAIIPIGYADGINRQLSNNIGSVFINDFECPIVGEISMDSLAINVTKHQVQEGELVEIFGNQLSVSEISKKINTIPYEIYAILNRRIKRIYSN